jgi:hypothetical protein
MLSGLMGIVIPTRALRIINRGTCGALSVDLAAAKEMVAILVVKDQYQLLERREVSRSVKAIVSRARTRPPPRVPANVHMR